MKQGIILIDKPEDWTSFDAVNYVRGIIASKESLKPKQVKVGHSGTLDPFATGLLILLVGKDYTRRASQFSKMDKVYSFRLVLGSSSTTGDPTGSIKVVSDRRPNKADISEVLNKFVGEIEQVPPAFSAIKINGVRSYKLAREGKISEIQSRRVTIYSLKLLSYKYPFVDLCAEVSSGTYIRSLGEDIGEALKTGAYVVELRRISVGQFKVDDANPPKELNRENIQDSIKLI
ncbi:MAG TPA: tRNA pseudouridine(55) synthase TruB [Candidatus Saccharimonadales bacterium]|nr:tRNA pseudouridine(55) synthase TruB [Candidatus Saccharimonadales bacterium]